MTTFGLTDQGLVIKRLEDVKAEIEEALKTILGPGINLLPTELLGQMVGIFSEREAQLWELTEIVYNSQYPDTAKGTSLDNVVAITAIERLEATKSSAIATATGDEATVIPQGSVVSVNGNPDARFVTIAPYTIGPGTDEVQEITFDDVPDAGDFTLIFEGDETGPINFSDTATDVQNALNALSNLSTVTVTGDFTSGFVVTFAGLDGDQPQELIEVGDNTLTASAVAVDIDITETTPGVLPNVEITLEGETAGAVQAPAGTLTVIEGVVAGWDSVTNAEDAVIGKEIETDAELLIRRALSLSAPATATIDAIRAAILEIDEVEDVAAYHNPTQVIDSEGRPPHSIDIIVLDGDDDEIAETLWERAPAGIELLGSTTVEIIDSQGFPHDIKFSRPTDVNIWLEIDLTTDNFFPTGGETLLRDFIVQYATDTFKIGDDVVVFGSDSIASAIADSDIPGIVDYEIRIGTAMSPTLDDNIPIAFDAIADLDTSRTTVTVL